MAATAYPNIEAALKATADAGTDRLEKVILGTPGTSLMYPSAEAGDTIPADAIEQGRLWEEGPFLPSVLTGIGDEMDRAFAGFRIAAADVTYTLLVPATWYSVNSNGATVDASHEMTVTDTTKITYTGPTTRTIAFMTAMSIECDTIGTQLSFSWRKGAAGADIWVTGLDVWQKQVKIPFSVFAVYSMAQNDYVQMFVQGNMACAVTACHFHTFAYEIR